MQLYLLVLSWFVLTDGRRHGRKQRQSKEVAPIIVGPPASAVGLVRGSVVLVCNATGNPRPHIEWYKENVKVSRNRYEIHSEEYNGGVISSLWILNARERRDAATFSCHASNKAGDENRDAQVTLIDEDEKPSGFSRVTTEPQTKTVERNRSVSLMCKVEGTPKPTVQWYKDYLPLKFNHSRMSISATGTLTILKSNDSDAGKYHCSAVNHYGSVFSEGAHIYVRVRRVAPRFSIPPLQKYKVQKNGDVNITCVAVGSPMPNVKWQKITRWGPEDIPKLDRTQNQIAAVIGHQMFGRLVGRVVLILRHVQDSANYTCVASSTINTIQTTTEVRIKAIPKPPIHLRRFENGLSSNTLGLSWDSADEEPIDSYTIYYRNRDVAGPKYDVVTNVPSTSFTVAGLKPFTEYELRVSATNLQGEGNTSKPLYLQTQEANPTSPPVDVKAYLFGINTVMVLWSEPQQPNGVITQYKLYYTSDKVLPVREWNTKVVEGNKRLTSLRNLTPSVTYRVCVSAINSVGESPKTAPVTVKTEQGVPSQPRNFRGTSVTKNSIRFVWEEPAGELQQDQQIISYSMKYECNETLCGRQKQITFPPSTHFTLLNLHPATVYRVQMAAQTRFGKGPHTSIVEVRTLAGAPTAPPQNVYAFPKNEQRIKVGWVPPPRENQNGDITKYTVYYAASSQIKEQATILHVLPQSTFKYIPNLQPYTKYNIWVSASTEIGEGPSSSMVSTTTSESTPGGPPSNVTVDSLNSTAIRVRWKPVSKHLSNGNIRGYQVAYVKSDVPTSPTRIVSTFEGELSNLKENQILEFIISGLQAKTRYSLFVAAFTIKGAGPPSEIKYATTKGQVPDRPTLRSDVDAISALILWDPPHNQYNNITGYFLKYRCENCPGSDQALSEWTVKGFDSGTRNFRPTKEAGVIPGWMYTFKLAALSDEGPGHEAVSHTTIPPTPPSAAPLHLNGTTVYMSQNNNHQKTNFGIKLQWSPLSWISSNGPITGYRLYWRNVIGSENVYANTTAVEPGYLLPNVELGGRYEFRVTAFNEAGEGPESSSVFVSVAEKNSAGTRGLVRNLKVSEISSNTIWLSWSSPSDISSARYLVTYLAKNSDTPNQTEPEGTNAAISGLHAGLTYNFTVTTFTSQGGFPTQLGSRWIIVQTASKFYSESPRIQTVTEDARVLLVFNQKIRFNNLIKKHLLIVVPWNMNRSTITDEYNLEVLTKNSYAARRQRRQANALQPYIAAAFESEFLPRKFSLGDQKLYGDFVNKALLRGTKYRVFLRASYETEHTSFSSSPFSDVINIPGSSRITPKTSLSKRPDDPVQQQKSESSGQLWIIGVVAGCVLVIGIIICFLFVRYRRKNGKGSSPLIKYSAPVAVKKSLDRRVDHDPVQMRREHYQTSGMKNHPPISLSEMSAHVGELCANDNLKFSQEYESIDPGQQFMWEHSAMELNKPKNRYANVVSYDHSRVTLSPIDLVPGSDYINANYISGYRRQNAYIATQGPITETISDFWRMVWEQRSNVIVMMTKCEERSKVKCEQYWPSKGTETYGLMKVTLIDEVELATYNVRTMALFKNGCNDHREIKHFQYSAWPDHGVPEHPTPVLSFMRRVKSSFQPDAGPIVVHCSAGVGRAGCFICIDSTLERMKQESTIDIYGQVTCMRAERNYMVQTEDQYIFIHDAILEAINCGNTELPARNLYNHLQKLTTPENDNPITAMELEFKRLASSRAPPARFISANLPCNKFKNRLVNILPYEGSRVCLQSIRGVEGSDYINANFIDGYRQKRAYIATQGPLLQTTDDFWRMLWEYNSTIVVMLTQLNESGRDKCHQYWPEGRSERYQYFVVDPMSEYNMPQYILREFKVTDARDGQSRTIRQFQFTDWPEQAVPKSGEGFIDFIGQVHKTKAQFGQEGPITIHCSSGVGRTGVFITLSIALERMRFENLVDMFQTVKMLRTQRPAMVQTEDQYQFCYRAALEYLGSFDHYANA